MKRFVFASHHSMAAGLKDTMEFLTKSEDALYDISAYMNEAGDEDLAAIVKDLFETFSPDDTVVVMTDLMSGSVNQKFFPYMNDHVFLLSGVNVPLAMQLMIVDEDMLTWDFILECVEEARDQLVFINDWQKQNSDGDEDE
ncbi:MAG: PTS sorbitol transporter subunit IIB [Lachnospiraceae bacterium]|nr:PTS sorbitol transporter subunit IIB [Lachnospiraceae bacterium]